MDMLNKKQKIIVIAVLIVAAGVIFFQYINSTKEIYSYEDKLNIVEEQEKETHVEEKEKKIIVHITGAVKKNGIVEVNENARINDVIEAAGGITEDADLTDVNLAYVVEDGQKIYIPSKEDKNLTEEIKNSENSKEIISEDAGKNVLSGTEKNSSSMTNINKSGLEGLKMLPGIRRIYCIKNNRI